MTIKDNPTADSEAPTASIKKEVNCPVIVSV